jgi:2,3-bisphosphoglycerate-independent phosphoglycerate mutase
VPHLLLILDGYGIAEDPSVSAIDHARKPFLDSLFATVPPRHAGGLG